MKFTASTKDYKTGYEMVLSECSYDIAMNWLSREIGKRGYEIWDIRKHINGLVFIHTVNKENGKRRMYFWDEDRQYLMGE